VGERVDHRRVVLPQLAATGVERLEVKRRCGWKATFGPVHAADLPRYLGEDGRKDGAMRRVRFGAFERSEMAVAWGGPAALLTGGGALLLAPAFALPLAALSLSLAFALFFLYGRLPGPRRSLFVAGSTALVSAGVALAGGGAAALGTAVVASAVLAYGLTVDYEGSTPIEGGSHFDERRFEIRLDLDRCKGIYSCWEVCPEACFDMPAADSPNADLRVDVELAKQTRKGRRPIALAHDERCVRCGACIVQCPLDALAFESVDGERIEPETIRRFKLNLLGSRSVSAPTPE